MRTIFTGLTYLTLTACAAKADAPVDLLDEIEAMVKLPSGALELDEYGRAYAFSDGKVVAHYLVPMSFEPEPNDGCAEALADGTTRPCEDGWEAEFDAIYDNQIAAGERRWFDDARDLPFMNDGGCSMVSFEYFPEEKRFARIECNGAL